MGTHLFGPVPSRRLGMSLGIDLVPHKVCSMNCVYCECGATTLLTARRDEYLPTAEVLDELEVYLDSNPAPDYCTLSGSGEPTLHSDFGLIIARIKERHPGQRVAVLTNGSLLSDPQVRRELMQADVVLPSLDAATERTFRRMDRPLAALKLEDIIQGLIDFRGEYAGAIWLEVMILPGYNDNEDDLARLRSAIGRIMPDQVQLNTLDRPGVLAGLRAAPGELLEKVASEWSDLVPTVLIAKASVRSSIPGYNIPTGERILETIRRRPCTIEDLQRMLNLHTNEIQKYLSQLEANGQISSRRQDRGIFYLSLSPLPSEAPPAHP